MNKSELMEMALEKLVGDMDDLEGGAAMEHSPEECPDPLGCKMHDSEAGDSLSGEDKLGLPSMKGAINPGDKPEEGEGKEPAAEDGLSADDAEELLKLLSKK